METQKTKNIQGGENPPIEILDGYSKISNLESVLMLIQFSIFSVLLTTIYLFLN